MLASKQFDRFVDSGIQSITSMPHRVAERMRANAVSAESQASTFRAHFNIFDGTLGSVCVFVCAPS